MIAPYLSPAMPTIQRAIRWKLVIGLTCLLASAVLLTIAYKVRPLDLGIGWGAGLLGLMLGIFGSGVTLFTATSLVLLRFASKQP